MRRLYSTFAPGWPGVGLLILRVVGGVAFVVDGAARLRSGSLSGWAALSIVANAAGILLAVGLWTPVSGTLGAIIGVWRAISEPGEPWVNILLGAMGAALALLGPGAYSVDARLFGWKRIEIRQERKP